jgi:hypothetical protein
MDLSQFPSSAFAGSTPLVAGSPANASSEQATVFGFPATTVLVVGSLLAFALSRIDLDKLERKAERGELDAPLQVFTLLVVGGVFLYMNRDSAASR